MCGYGNHYKLTYTICEFELEEKEMYMIQEG